jgi:cellulose synthase/poly-beta-1,6-N-acetylglucosamine synthase-like glycosyltransferase
MILTLLTELDVYRCDSISLARHARARGFCYAQPKVENLFYFLATVQILVGLYLIGQGLAWFSYVRRRVRSESGFFTPLTAVLCPCKGMESGLEQNLTSLTVFDYPNYEVFFILASANDSACSIARRVAEKSRTKAHVLIAGRPEGCSEKVNNLRFGIEQLGPDFEVFAFVDSDGRPGKSWLRRLIAPLKDTRTGASTTMRWFLPMRNNFATALLAAWNAPIVTMLTEKGPNFCWGGGTAIRRSTFEQIGVLDEWRHSASDDYSLTRALERAGLAIVFVPECLTPSYVETDFRDLLQFTNRQMLITRIYSQKMWTSAAATHFLYCLTLLLGAYLTLQKVIETLPAFHLAILTFVPFLLAMIRSGIRMAAVTEALPSARSMIMARGQVYILFTVFIPFLYLLNFGMSALTRKMRWRGVRYELISPNQTRVIG